MDRRAPRPLDAAWLSGRLRERGLLEAGAVARVSKRRTTARGGTAQVSILHIDYSADALGTCPRRLFCKHTRADRPQDAREVVFYRELAPRTPGPVAPACVEAWYDEPARRVFLLLEDLSGSHRSASPDTHAPGMPAADAVLAAGVLADLHRRWWCDSSLVQRLPALRPLAGLEMAAARCRGAAPAFRRAFAAQLAGGDAARFERALAGAHARAAGAVRSRRAVTLLHGDPHPANLLLPRDPARDRARLVDWSACTVGLAALDLAHLLLWRGADGAGPAQARPVIEAYSAALGGGIYPPAACAADVPLAVELQLLRPLLMFANGVPARWCAEVLRRALNMAREWGAGLAD